MRQCTEGRTLADHAETRLEQRLIESPAIVRNHHVELFEVLVQRAQQAGFFAKIAHEELPDAETVLRDAAHADQERISARPTRQASGFGVKETPFPRRYAGDLAV